MNEVRKRKLSSSEDQQYGKRYFIVLESEPEVHSDSDSDSVRSIQSAETALAADTSDTCTKSSASEPELSPASLSELSDLDRSSGSTSSVNGSAFIDVVINVEDDHWADNSDSNSFHSFRHDTEIPKADYWQCARCGCKKNNPVFRVCEKCFQSRKEESLPRPKITRRKKRRKSHNSYWQQKTSKLDDAGPSGVPESSSQETVASAGSLSSQGSGASTLSSQGGSDLCNGCETQQIDAAFYHTSYGHTWGCYNCSKRAWKLYSHRCPMCNGRCRVIRLIK